MQKGILNLSKLDEFDLIKPRNTLLGRLYKKFGAEKFERLSSPRSRSQNVRSPQGTADGTYQKLGVNNNVKSILLPRIVIQQQKQQPGNGFDNIKGGLSNTNNNLQFGGGGGSGGGPLNQNQTGRLTQNTFKYNKVDKLIPSLRYGSPPARLQTAEEKNSEDEEGEKVNKNQNESDSESNSNTEKQRQRKKMDQSDSQSDASSVSNSQSSNSKVFQKKSGGDNTAEGREKHKMKIKAIPDMRKKKDSLTTAVKKTSVIGLLGQQQQQQDQTNVQQTKEPSPEQKATGEQGVGKDKKNEDALQQTISFAREEDEGEAILRPKDFMTLIKYDKELQSEFCYLNKRSNPYDWEIVEFDRCNKKHYMTISVKGLQLYNEGDVRFMTMDQWNREVKLYEKITSITFFKNYKMWKSFSVWKRLMRRNIMKECSKIIEKKLFYLDDTLRQALIEIRGQTLEINQINFFDNQDFQGPVQFEQFQEYTEDYRRQKLIKFITLKQKGILKRLQASCEDSLDKFKKANDINIFMNCFESGDNGIGGNNDGKLKGNKKVKKFIIPNNITNVNGEIVVEEVKATTDGGGSMKKRRGRGTQQGKEQVDSSNGIGEQMMPFTQEAIVRMHKKKLRNFVKMVDYLIQDAKVDLIIKATANIGEQLEDLNRLAQREDLPFFRRQNCWIIIKVAQEGGVPFFRPEQEQLKRIYDELITKNITALNNSHQIYLRSQELTPFISSSEDSEKSTAALALAAQQQAAEEEEKQRQTLKAKDGNDQGSGQGEQKTQDEEDEMVQIVFRNTQFQSLTSFFYQQLDKAYVTVGQHSRVLEQPLKIYKKHQSMDKNMFNDLDADDFSNRLEEFKKDDDLLNSVEQHEKLGLYLFDCSALKKEISNAAFGTIKMIHDVLPRLTIERAQDFSHQIMQLYDKISFNPANLEQFVRFSEDTTQIDHQMEALLMQSSSIMALMYLCLQHRIPMTDKQKTLINQSHAQMSSLRKRIDEILANQDNNIERFRRDLEKIIPQINERVKALDERLQTSNVGRKNADVDTMCGFLVEFGAELRSVQAERQNVQIYETALQITEFTDFEKLDNLARQFGLMEKLWLGKQEWKDAIAGWMGQHFQKLELEKMSQLMERMTGVAALCAREIEIGEVAQSFRKDVDKFRNMYLALQSVRDTRLGTRQWDEIRELVVVGRPEKELKDLAIKPEQLFKKLNDKAYTLAFFYELQLDVHAEKLADITLQAIKEGELLLIVAEVDEFWKTSKLKIGLYKNKQEVFILEKNEELMGRLDEHLLAIIHVLANKFVENIRTRVEQQLRSLRYLQELLEAWFLQQKRWMNLEPILQTQYAQKNLNKEAKMFQLCDQNWRKLMRQARDNPYVKKWAEDVKTRGLLQTLKQGNQQLEVIQKALEDFLERRRENFQRFYFLSNEELLNLLSKVYQTTQLQQYLRKIFEGIAKLELDAKENIQGFVSQEGETIQVRNCLLRGEVDEWLQTIEEAMKANLKSYVRNALVKYEQEDTVHARWVLEHPCQVVLTVDAIEWTRISEDYLTPSNGMDVATWLESCVMQIEDVVAVIKGGSSSSGAGNSSNQGTSKEQPQLQQLTAVHRRTVEALITQEIHFRDTIAEIVSQGITQLTDFKWQQTLRLYYEEEVVVAQQGTLRLSYGYEYVGAAARLVNTPLMDRCWLTITNALNLHMGAAPTGPAGTGKSESIKDLARTLARICIVFNCSDQISTKVVEKLMMGLCFTGSWLCLDEFNRIEIEVLSVIAQQIMTIRSALLRDAHSLYFFGRQIMLNHNIGIFITMNPNYAGRSELPGNLKALFRPIAMMQPDSILICEVLLFGQGFSAAKQLAIKISKFYQLCSEQLTQQDHYDFGMRAIKSVLTAAGQIKRQQINLTLSTQQLQSGQSGSNNNGQDPQQQEQQQQLPPQQQPFTNSSEQAILMQAIRDCDLPKLLARDVPLFNAILKDLFPETLAIERPNPELTAALQQHMQQQNLKQAPCFMERLYQLYDTTRSRFGTMLVGPSLGGKTTLVTTLQAGLNIMMGQYQNLQQLLQQSPQQTVVAGQTPSATVQDQRQRSSLLQPLAGARLSVINPKAITMSELYGIFDSFSQQWTDGLASKIIRQYVMEDTTKDYLWLMLDGPVDPLWVENLNTVLDDSMLLCLANGERIKMKQNMKIMFEVENLAHAQPSTVSRCGMVYVDEQVITYEHIVGKFLDDEFEFLPDPKLKEYISQLVAEAGPKFINFVVQNSRLIIPMSATGIVLQICSMIKILLQTESSLEPLLVDENWRKSIEKLIIFAFFWSVAPLVHGNSFGRFERYLWDIFSLEPVKGSLTNFFLVINRNGSEYNKWDLLIEPFRYQVGMNYFDMFVPTKETVCYSWFIKKFIKAKKSIMLSGISGTSKTVCMRNILKERQAASFFSNNNSNNFGTTNNVTQQSSGQGQQQQQQQQQTLATTSSAPSTTATTASQQLQGGKPGNGNSTEGNVVVSGSSNNGSKTLANDTDMDYLEMNFTAQTSSQSVQAQIEGRLQQHRKNGRTVLLPPPNQDFIIFVDDIGMPRPDKYDAQPALELLRVFQEYHGFFDRKSLTWNTIESSFLVATARVPNSCLSNSNTGGAGGGGGVGGGGGGGGTIKQGHTNSSNSNFCSNHTNQILNPRLMRFFTVMNMPNPPEESLHLIFSSILKAFLNNQNFKSEVKDFGERGNIVNSTLAIYEAIQQTLLPVPRKSHYLFNLRDVSKVFQGILMASHRSVQTQEKFGKLWLHEVCRVFADRLVCEADQKWLRQTLMKIVQSNFKFDMTEQEIFDKETPLLFGNFMGRSPVVQGGDRSPFASSPSNTLLQQQSLLMQDDFVIIGSTAAVSNSNNRIYEEITDYARLQSVVNQFMVEETNLNIVLFKQTIEHAVRIARVLAQDRGHMILVAVGGSGKKSLCTLGCALNLCQMVNFNDKSSFSRQIRQFNGNSAAAISELSQLSPQSPSMLIQEQYQQGIYNLMKMAAFQQKSICLFVYDDEEDNNKQDDDKSKDKTADIKGDDYSNYLMSSESVLEDMSNIINSGIVPNLLQNEQIEEITQALGKEAVKLIQAQNAQQNMAMGSAGTTTNSSSGQAAQSQGAGSNSAGSGGANQTQAEGGVGSGTGSGSGGSSGGTFNANAANIQKQCLDLFLRRVRQNLHIIVSLSSISSILRSRLTMFPALLSCCTFDWVQSWPDEALGAVAQHFFQEQPAFEGVNEEICGKLVESCIFMYKNVQDAAKTYFQQSKRQIYFTPKSYINMLETYAEFMTRKSGSLQRQVTQMNSGINRIVDAKKLISSLQETLKQLQPQLRIRTDDMERLIQKLEQDKLEASNIKQVVSEEERITIEKAEKVKEMKNEADKILQEFMPVLQKANEQIGTISRNDFSEIKGQSNPNQQVKFTLECVAMLLDEKVEWDNIKKLISDTSFLSRLKNFNAQKINPATMAQLKVKIEGNPQFKPNVVKTINASLKPMCEWVLSMINFFDVFQETQKKKEIVKGLKKELKEAEDALANKRKELDFAVQKVNQLEKEYSESQQIKDQLKHDIQKTEQRLVNANHLAQGLTDEEQRWKVSIQELQMNLQLLPANILLASAVVVFSGAFPRTFRNKILKQWIDFNNHQKLQINKNITLESILGDPLQTRDWQAKGLPSDSVSLENAIITENCHQCPLIIDPQQQGLQWLKNIYKQQNLTIINHGASNIFKIIQQCNSLCQPLIISGIVDSMDSRLDSLMQKNGSVAAQLAKHQQQKAKSGKLISRGSVFGQRRIARMGDIEIEMNPGMKLYLITNLYRPNLSPKMFNLCCVVNFSVTLEALEEQLLAMVVQKEMPEIEMEKCELITTIGRGKVSLHNNEKRILELLTESDEGLILDDVELISNLQQSKSTATQLKDSISQSERKQMDLEKARRRFYPVAQRSALLYFIVFDLVQLDVMYTYSLNYFKQLFAAVLGHPIKSEDQRTRINILIENFTNSVYLHVSRGLINRHKTLFAFLIAVTIDMKINQKVTQQEWEFFLQGLFILQLRKSTPNQAEIESNNKLSQPSQSVLPESPEQQSLSSLKQQQNPIKEEEVENAVQQESAITFNKIDRQHQADSSNKQVQSKTTTQKKNKQSTSLNQQQQLMHLNQASSSPQAVFQKDNWQNLVELAEISPQFKFVVESVTKNPKDWENWANTNSSVGVGLSGNGPLSSSNYIQNSPGSTTSITGNASNSGGGNIASNLVYSLMKIPLPGNLDSQLTRFAKLILIKLAKPERTISAIEEYISIITGMMNHHSSSATVNQVKLEDVAAEMKFNTPLLIITTPGSDAYGQVQRLAYSPRPSKSGGSALYSNNQTQQRLISISLGQGQGDSADRAIAAAAKDGSWILLQNLHLAKSYLPQLQKRLEWLQQLDQEFNKDMRIYLTTSANCTYIPVPILQYSMKLMEEQPRGLKANIIKQFSKFKPDIMLTGSELQRSAFRKLLFSLTFFHAVLQERKKFGPVGWNVQYEFNDSDLDSSVQLLIQSLNEQSQSQQQIVLWDMLQYLVSDINYGGRITNEWDRRVLRVMLRRFCNTEVLGPNYKFSKNTNYSMPADSSTLEKIREHINNFPEIDKQEIFGVHENNTIAIQLNELSLMLDSILAIQPQKDVNGNSGGSDNTEEGGSLYSTRQLQYQTTMQIQEELQQETQIQLQEVEEDQEEEDLGKEEAEQEGEVVSENIKRRQKQKQKTYTKTKNDIDQEDNNQKDKLIIEELVKKIEQSLPIELKRPETQKEISQKKTSKYVRQGTMANQQPQAQKLDQKMIQQQEEEKRLATEKLLMDPINVCLTQECERMNRLLERMRYSTFQLLQAIKGELLMTPELEKMLHSIFINQVPKAWEAVSFTSTRPLASWFENLKERVEFVQTWLNEQPTAYKLGLFFFPQGFLTSQLQSYSRKHKISIDSLSFSFQFKNFTDKEQIHARLEEGCYIYGLQMEGCKYNANQESLEDSFLGQRFYPGPIIHFLPTIDYQPPNDTYSMPVYKTLDRGGTFTNNDYSNNFITAIDCPTKEKIDQWILRGAAFICDTDK